MKEVVLVQMIASRDGTQIVFAVEGSGPPLVLVHGTGSNHTRWLPLFPYLTDKFTVAAIERRGRGGSGDSEVYAIEEEYHDTVAVVDSLSEPVFLLGHSFGGVCALEASLLTQRIRKLVLYEPVVDASIGSTPGDDQTAALEEKLAEGDRDGLLQMFYGEFVGLSVVQIEQMRAMPDWTIRLAAAHTIVRESRAEEAYSFNPDRFRDMATPTLLLEGSESPELFKVSTRLLSEALPNSRIVTMPGQGHVAMMTDPELFLSEVTGFLLP